MVLKNTTKNTTISANYRYADTIIQKTIGLMFARKPTTLIFRFSKEKKIPLHMFFVFFPIDVLFLNKQKQVVEIKENFKPWTYYNPKTNAMYVVELPKGSVKKSGTEVKDVIEFQQSTV